MRHSIELRGCTSISWSGKKTVFRNWGSCEDFFCSVDAFLDDRITYSSIFYILWALKSSEMTSIWISAGFNKMWKEMSKLWAKCIQLLSIPVYNVYLMFFKTKKQNEHFNLISTHLKKNVQFILEDLASRSSLPFLCKIRKFENDAEFLMDMFFVYRRGFIGFKSSHISQKKKSHNRKLKCWLQWW